MDQGNHGKKLFPGNPGFYDGVGKNVAGKYCQRGRGDAFKERVPHRLLEN